MNSINNAIQWIYENTIDVDENRSGICISSKDKNIYPEVSGYFIPTLYNIGEKELARKYTAYLLSIQNDDGSFNGPTAQGKPYLFDSGQILKGLLTMHHEQPSIGRNIAKTCDYIMSEMLDTGEFKNQYNGAISEFILIYVLEPLIRAGKTLNISRYVHMGEKSLALYKEKNDLLDFNHLSHFYAYILEGLYDLNEIDLVSQAIEDVLSLQKKDGSISASPDNSFICSTGLAQIAVVAYKLNFVKEADKMMAYLQSSQNESGGFYGSYEKDPKYFPNAEISWAVKYYVDAYLLKVEKSFDENNLIFPREIQESDGRLVEIIGYFGNVKGKILDAGCGAGRFINKIKHRFPSCEAHGLDISNKLLEAVPSGIITIKASLLNTGYSDNSFDYIFCVESLEHSISYKMAINEMYRILKPNGKFIVIDKNQDKLGLLKIDDWEQWFDDESMLNAMTKTGFTKVTSNFVTYGKNEADGLFLSWKAEK